MFILLSKILPTLIYPLGLSLVLWIVAAILYRRGHTRWSLRCGVAGAVVILFFSCPLVGESLLEALENDFEVRAVKAYPRVDAIVVLGGMGTIVGVVLAAVLLTLMPELFREFENLRMLFFGMAMVFVMIWRPRGLLRVQRRHYEETGHAG